MIKKIKGFIEHVGEDYHNWKDAVWSGPDSTKHKWVARPWSDWRKYDPFHVVTDLVKETIEHWAYTVAHIVVVVLTIAVIDRLLA